MALIRKSTWVVALLGLLITSIVLANVRLQLGAYKLKADATSMVKQATTLTSDKPTIHQSHQLSIVEYASVPFKKAKQYQKRLAKANINTFVDNVHATSTHTPIKHRQPTSRHTPPPTKKRVTGPPKLRDKKPLVHEQSRLWNLRDVDVRAVIDEVSKETGKNFIVDPRVRGKITIVSTTPIHPRQVYPLFLSALQTAGFAAIDSGDVVKIVPNIAARNQATKVSTTDDPGEGDESIVRVVPINYVSAEQLVPIIRPLVPQWGTVNAYRPSNALVISGRADNVKRLARIIKQVDTPKSHSYTVVRLRNALADEVAKTLKAIVDHNQGNLPAATVSVDNRSNAIVIAGTPGQRLRLRLLISQLDSRDRSGLSGNTQIIPLRYLNASDLVPILSGIARSRFGGDVGSVIGTRTTQNPLRTSPGPGVYASDVQNNESPTPAPNIVLQPGAKTAKTETKEGKGSQPKVEIIAEPNSNSIIINAPPTLMRTLKQVIRRLDVRPQQVDVQALIAEVDENEIGNLGIQWGTVGKLNNIAGIPLGFNQGLGVITKDGFKEFQARLNALTTRDRANVLSTPSVVVLNNHQAQISIGTQVSAKSSEYPNNAGGTTGATPFTTFQRLNVNLHLYVTPQINRGNSVQLTINHGDDSLANPDRPTDNPVVNTSSIRTTVLINSGDILVLGGLIQNKLNDSDSKVPILGNLPIIGQAFKDKTRSRNRKKLMVFIRPIIIKDPLAGTQISYGLYQKLRQEQLRWMRDIPYRRGDNDTALPKWHHNLKLPPPFSLATYSK